MDAQDFEYGEDGRLLSGPIMVGIYSPYAGSIDPTTGRTYGIYCMSCKGKFFYEDESGYELRCKSCNVVLAVKAMEEMIH